MGLDGEVLEDLVDHLEALGPFLSIIHLGSKSSFLKSHGEPGLAASEEPGAGLDLSHPSVILLSLE